MLFILLTKALLIVRFTGVRPSMHFGLQTMYIMYVRTPASLVNEV